MEEDDQGIRAIEIRLASRDHFITGSGVFLRDFGPEMDADEVLGVKPDVPYPFAGGEKAVHHDLGDPAVPMTVDDEELGDGINDGPG